MTKSVIIYYETRNFILSGETMSGDVYSKVLVLILLALLPGNAQAFTAEEYSTSITLDHSGNSKVLVSLVFDSTTVKEYMSLPIFEPEYLTVTDQFGDLKTATLDSSALIRPNENVEGYSFDMRYVSSKLTEKRGGMWELSYTLEPFEHLQFDKIETINMEIELPSNAELKTFSEGGDVAVSDDGCIDVHWMLEEKKIDEPIVFKVEYIIRPPPFDVSSKNASGNSYFSKTLLGALVFSLILGATYFIRNRINSTKKGTDEIQIKEDVINSLSQTQKKILNTLAESGGNLYQSEIQKKSNIAKATLSRNLNQLTEREIISKEGRGNNNKIILNDWVLD